MPLPFSIQDSAHALQIKTGSGPESPAGSPAWVVAATGLLAEQRGFPFDPGRYDSRF